MTVTTPVGRQEADLESRIGSVLEELGHFSGLGGVYFRFDQQRFPIEGPGVCRFCSGCLRHPKAGGLCQSNVNTAAVQGFAIGDAWYSRCWLGVDCVVIPVAPRGDIIGAIEVGGYFSPGEGEATQGKILSRLAGLDSGGMVERFVTALQGMRELEFSQAKATARFVLDATFAKGLNQSSLFAMRQKIFQQQQRLNRRIMDRSASAADTLQWPLNAMATLVTASGGDASQEVARRQAMDDFLTHLLLEARGDLTRIKAGLLVLCGLLARRQAERGASWPAIMGRIDEKLLELEKLADPESLCFWAENLFFAETAAAAKPALAPSHPLADRVHDWLRLHYAEPVGIDDVAAAVGASRSNLIHKLKKETGNTFGDMLLAARMSEAKRLLAFTSLSIGEICRRCGFQDQSYFTKVFRREINLTPREFRRLLTEQQSLPES